MDSAVDGVTDPAERDLEEGIERDFTRKMSYGDYLQLDTLLTAQQPPSDPPQHDELLFIIQHQTSELWLKLLIHELRSAASLLRADDLAPALKRLARVKHIQHTLTDQWSGARDADAERVRPDPAFPRYRARASSRRSTARSSSCSATRTPTWWQVFSHDEAARTALDELLREPSLYDEFLAYLARRGYAVPADVLDRDWSQPYRLDAEASSTSSPTVYAAPHEHWGVYETCEELVDLEDNFQQWRFRHLQVVQRTIGQKTGTGGSTGVDFLRRALDLTFFPELYEVRTRIGA